MNIELFIGMISTGFISLLIAHWYYKRATRDLVNETKKLQKLNSDLKNQIEKLQEATEIILEDGETIRRVVVKNTTYDPDYPYK